MERKALIGKIPLLLFLSLGLMSGCGKKLAKKEIHTKGGIVISGYTPKVPTARNDIEISVIRSPSGTVFEWFGNGKRIGSNSPTITHGQYKRGDTLFCYVYYKNKEEGKVGPIIIQDTPPIIHSEIITPGNAKHGSDLRVLIRATDADSDDISYIFNWYVNNKLVSNDSILNGNIIKGGDRVYVTVTPFDGFLKGQSVESPPITVINSPPVITSNPPSHLNGRSFEYQVTANDPDGDPIRYSLVNPPEGATINSNSGLLNYIIPQGHKGSVNFVVKASDNHGNYSLQKFSYNIR